MEVVKSPALEVYKERVDIVLRGMIKWKVLVVGGQMVYVILEVFSNVNDSMILNLMQQMQQSGCHQEGECKCTLQHVSAGAAAKVEQRT